jgi:hypothetical protein
VKRLAVVCCAFVFGAALAVCCAAPARTVRPTPPQAPPQATVSAVYFLEGEGPFPETLYVCVVTPAGFTCSTKEHLDEAYRNMKAADDAEGAANSGRPLSL